jgi:predicted patatin/cPLA2 family phospholipase
MYPHRHLVKFISMLILDCKYRKNFQESFIRMEEMMVWMANIFRIIQFSGNPEHRFAARLRYLCIQIGRMDCFKKNTEMKTGLVLEGGAMRGLFTCGVLDVLLESGVSFDGMIGVSAGAAFGCNFKSWQNGRALRYNLAYAKDRRYCSLWSWLTTGNLFGAEFAYHTIADRLDIFDNEAFERNPMEFYLVATDVTTGQAFYKQVEHGGASLYEWLRASSSMPIVSKTVRIEGREFLDGGIADSIPLRYFQSLGYERNVVVLTQPIGYEKKPMPMMPFIRVMLRQYSNLTDAMARRHEMYNRQLRYVAEEAIKGLTLVICPDDVLPIGRISHDRQRMWQTYEIGRHVAKKRLGEILGFLY